MAISQIIVNFTPCDPAPANGYNIQYRVVGDVSYIDAGNFTTSPATINVSYADGTPFEAFIRADCGDGLFGTEIPLFGLRLLFVDISAAATLIGGDITDVSLWNIFYDMGVWAGSPFTQVVIRGNEVVLIGAVGMTIKDNSFSSNTDIIRVWDEVWCVTGVGQNVFLLSSLQTAILPAVYNVQDGAFRSTSAFVNMTMPNIQFAGPEAFHDATEIVIWDLPNLTDAGTMCFMGCDALQFNFPALVNIGDNCFNQCQNVTDFYLPLCTNLGGTTGDDFVFFNTTGNTITLTIPTATQTDGDVVYLQANNTVTLVLI